MIMALARPDRDLDSDHVLSYTEDGKTLVCVRREELKSEALSSSLCHLDRDSAADKCWLPNKPMTMSSLLSCPFLLINNKGSRRALVYNFIFT